MMKGILIGFFIYFVPGILGGTGGPDCIWILLNRRDGRNPGPLVG
jgi:hypothetical protein